MPSIASAIPDRLLPLHYSPALLFALAFYAPLARADNGNLIDRVEALLPDHVGAAVLALDGGQVIFKHAWGKRRHDQPEPCTATTNFRLASVSKQFTATAVMLQVERGAVALDDTLDRFFPNAPDYWRRITVHHLLTHTSGLPDYEKLIPKGEKLIPKGEKLIPKGTALQLTDLNVLALLRETREPLFDPGTKFAYSNSGYTLLGLIVEASADRPFHRFMRTEVFAPAGMNQSVLYVAGMNSVSDRAYGHALDEEGNWTRADQSITSAVRGDGGVYSSLNDLERWLAALDGDSPLRKSSTRAMQKAYVQTDRGQRQYGYGWFIGNYRGERRVLHGGSTRGFSSMLQRFPDRRAAVVILLNWSSPKTPEETINRIVDLLMFEQNQ